MVRFITKLNLALLLGHPILYMKHFSDFLNNSS